jgi:hypothetical protein
MYGNCVLNVSTEYLSSPVAVEGGGTFFLLSVPRGDIPLSPALHAASSDAKCTYRNLLWQNACVFVSSV